MAFWGPLHGLNAGQFLIPVGQAGAKGESGVNLGKGDRFLFNTGGPCLLGPWEISPMGSRKVTTSRRGWNSAVLIVFFFLPADSWWGKTAPSYFWGLREYIQEGLRPYGGITKRRA